jgi:hypothetical protein
MVERLHRHLKEALRARGAIATWDAELPWVLLGLRSSPREDTNLSPAQVLYGTPLVLPNQYLSINDEQTINEFIIQIDCILKNIPMTRHNTAADKELPEDLPQELWAADRVWVRRGGHAPPLAPLYDGPYTVLHRSLRHFRLQMGNREDNVSTSRLKPCAGGAAIPMAAAPRRDRPLPGFLHAQGKHLQAATRNATGGHPRWQRDYTFFAASHDQEARGEHCGHPTTGVPARVQRVTHSATRPHQNWFLFTTSPVLAAVFTVTIMYTCIH